MVGRQPISGEASLGSPAFRPRWISAWLLLSLLQWLFIAPPPPVARATQAPPPWRAIYELGDPDPGVRFAAARKLIASGLKAEELEKAFAKEPFPEIRENSDAARVATEFVSIMLRGESPHPAKQAPGSAPAVVFISIDTLRADHLGCYGYQRDTSPVIDELAASGTSFEAVSTTSWTLPSHMSMFTSLYPSFHKLEGSRDAVGLDAGEETFVQRMKEAGYSTAGIVANTFLEPRWGFARGYDFYRRLDGDAREQVDAAILWLGWHRLHVARGLHPPHFFLFLHVNDPHEPYAAPAPFTDLYFPAYQGRFRGKGKHVGVLTDLPFEREEDFRYVVARYDAEIRYVDTQLGRLIEQLEKLGLRDSSLIVLTADHGEEFLDHGAMGHKETLYDEQLRVPLILSLPQLVAAGRRPAGQVSLVDIAPTILDFAGLPALVSAQGKSLRALAIATPREPGTAATAEPRPVFSELGPLGEPWERPFHRKTARDGAAKLIINYLPDGTVRKEYYDLDRDPGERDDRYDDETNAPALRRLEQSLEELVAGSRANRPGVKDSNRIELGDEAKERLRALGYDP